MVIQGHDDEYGSAVQYESIKAKCGGPVEVEDVEDGDVAGPDAPQQAVDVPVDPGVPRDARSCIGITREKR